MRRTGANSFTSGRKNSNLVALVGATLGWVVLTFFVRVASASRGRRARRSRWFPLCHDPIPHASALEGRSSEGHQLIMAGCAPQSPSSSMTRSSSRGRISPRSSVRVSLQR